MTANTLPCRKESAFEIATPRQTIFLVDILVLSFRIPNFVSKIRHLCPKTYINTVFAKLIRSTVVSFHTFTGRSRVRFLLRSLKFINSPNPTSLLKSLG
jgi:hypothetical protein